MKFKLAGVGSGFATLAFLATIPVFVATGGAITAGLGSFAFLGYRTYRRMQSRTR